MNETTNTFKANEDLKKAFIGILKDLRQITKGFQKLNNIQKKDPRRNEGRFEKLITVSYLY